MLHLDAPIKIETWRILKEYVCRSTQRKTRTNNAIKQMLERFTYLNASTSRRWHFCLLMRQKPAHPVGSLGSRGILQVGASSSTRATQTSSGRQSSQYLVELRLDGLVASVSASDVSGARLSGNDEPPFKRILAARVLVAEGCIGVVDDTADASFCSCSLFDPRRNVPAANTSLSDDESFVDDFRYCWMICSFSGSAKNQFLRYHDYGWYDD